MSKCQEATIGTSHHRDTHSEWCTKPPGQPTVTFCPEDPLDPGKSLTLTVHGKEVKSRREDVSF